MFLFSICIGLMVVIMAMMTGAEQFALVFGDGGAAELLGAASIWPAGKRQLSPSALARQFEAALRRKLFFLRKYHHYDVPATAWNDQYSTGRWEYLKDLSEVHRNSIIAGCCQRLATRPSVLDVGCGEGILQEMIAPWYASYVGIDLSQEAINKAQSKSDARTTFLCTDATTFAPQSTYDIIIFNECLYYFPDPLQVARSLAKCVRPDGGHMIVSMYLTPTSLRIWRMLESAFQQHEAVRLSHHSGKEFDVRVFQPLPQPA
jgi:2-polyprenyl-6-hydroxyphenyl methylase/3-demethylubiquinone-9 3-methyltransferase